MLSSSLSCRLSEIVIYVVHIYRDRLDIILGIQTGLQFFMFFLSYGIFKNFDECVLLIALQP